MRRIGSNRYLLKLKTLATRSVMANTSGKATIRQASYPTYRPLDRSKSEFRLLKILPSANRLEADARPLDFSQDPVRCELQYASLDVLAARFSAIESSKNSISAYIFQDTRRTRANDAETDVGALMDSLESQLGRMLSVDHNTVYEIGAERLEALQELYEKSRQTLEVWRPEGIQLRPKSFKDWLSSWVWTPLSGDTNHLEEKSLGYFALSYVWRDQGQVTYGTDDPEIRRMVAASGLTMRQALELTDMSPQMIEELCNQEGGSADDSAEIVLDGVPVPVGRNLEKALRTLREMPEISNGTRVWVDALCINQQDVQEKNFEVKRMGDIYGKADRVVSYLGEESDQSGSILEFMDAIGEVMQQARVLAPITLGFLQNVQADMAFSMARFLMRTYFSRIWIVQEVVLGGEKSIAICGTRRFSWTNLLRCGKMLNAGMAAASWNFDMQLGWIQNEEEEPYCVTLADLKDGITKLQMLRDARIDSRGEEGENNQVARRVPGSSTLWFRIASSNNATDSRDLIYGMMDLLPKKLTDFINVDYASPNQFVDVMRMFAEAHIKSTQSLHWILHRSYSPFLGHQDWPTWVPNMAQRFSSAHWDWTVNLDGIACPNIPCTPSFIIASDTGKHLLVCKGMKLDMILNATQNVVTDTLHKKMSMIHILADSMTSENAEEIYPIMQNLQSSVQKQQWLIVPEGDHQLTTNTNNLRTVPIASAMRYGNTEGLKAALNKCFSRFGVKLVGGQSIFNFPLDVSEEDKVTLNQSQASREFNAPMVQTFNVIRNLFADLNLWGPTFRDLFPAHAANVDPASFSAPEIEGVPMSVARLFTTFGGYVGACLCNVRAGDELFLLAGCSMPVLLKRSAVVAGAYELRGGVYVPGLMAGEAFYGKERPRDHFKTLLIC